jgi:hypothetical protein
VTLRLALVLALLALLAAGCGTGGGGGAAVPAAPGQATPHLAETEVVDVARGHSDDLQLAWVKALRVASATELNRLMTVDTTHSPDWFLVQTCSFQGSAKGYWANPVVHKVIGADDAGAADPIRGSCDANAAWPPPAKPTGDECMDGWNAWIQHAPIAYRAAAAAAKEAFAGRLDNRCIVVLRNGDQGVTLMEGAGGAWSVFDTNAAPADPNARVNADGTIRRK